MINSRFISENEKLFFALRELLSKVEDITSRYEKLRSSNQYLTTSTEKFNNTLLEAKQYIEKLENEKIVISDDLMKLQKAVLEKEDLMVTVRDEIVKLEEMNKSLQVKLASKEDDVNKLKNNYEVELTNQKELIKEKETQLEQFALNYDSKVDILIAENQNLEEKLKKLESVIQESKLSPLNEEEKGAFTVLNSENGLSETNREEIKEKINRIIEKIDEMIG